MNDKLDDILKKANIARHVGIILAESIYKYIGGLISLEDLQYIVDNLVSKDYITRFKHQYILKDTYDSTLTNMFIDDLDKQVTLEDDTDTLVILEEGELIDRTESTS